MFEEEMERLHTKQVCKTTTCLLCECYLGRIMHVEVTFSSLGKVDLYAVDPNQISQTVGLTTS